MVRRNHVSINPRRAGVEARPYGASGEVCAQNRRRQSSGERRTEDGAPYDVWEKFPHRNYAVRHPAEGASGTPPPTVVACG